MQPSTETAPGADEEALSTETDSDYRCEGRVRTCAHCGRPTSECDGTDCEHLLETQDWMVPSYSTRD